MVHHGTTVATAQAGTSLKKGLYYRSRGTTAPRCGTTARQESHGLGRARMKINYIRANFRRNWVVRKPDAVLPPARRGTTVVGADEKNFIRAYYRDTAVLGRRATVLRLQGSGTTVGPRGTTALDERYYRGGRGCKKLHPPLLPHRSGTRPGCRGTTAPKGRYYRDTPRYYRLYLWYYRKYSSSRQFFAQPR